MKIDTFGQVHRTSNELCNLLYLEPNTDLHAVEIDDPEEFNRSIKEMYYDFRPLEKYIEPKGSVTEFDAKNQATWFMPDEYKTFDVAKYVLDQCQTEEELQRVGQELLMYVDRGLLPLLQFLKFFVDTMRKNNIVWGVGRGSSVASYVLFLLGVHRINSLYFDLQIEEFLK